MPEKMISVEQAQRHVLRCTTPAAPIQVSLQDALGLVLAEPVLAKVPLPVFDNSAMDGYCMQYNGETQWEVTGEVAAGSHPTSSPRQGEAYRIFTGAALPEGCDTVIMQEHLERTGNVIVLTGPAPQKGQHVRSRGEEIEAGDTALFNGEPLSVAAIGFCAMLGHASVTARPMPTVSILTTGDELAQPGTSLRPGQIYESNSATLEAACKQVGVRNVRRGHTNDTLTDTVQAIQTALGGSDLLLITGGISVGDYDFVAQALEQIGVQEVFHKVTQKPGKPLWFGTWQDKLVFALPGNPASALVCFYEYVLPAIRKRCGHREMLLPAAEVELLHDVSKRAGRTWFVRAKVSANGVQSLEGQGSHMMGSFARANALMMLERDNEGHKKGDMVTVHLLPTI